MFRPSEIIIEAFTNSLRDEFQALFGKGSTDPIVVKKISTTILSHHALGDALYHNLDHVLVVTNVAKDIIRGRVIRDNDVSELDWINFIVAVMCVDIGMIRGAIKGDTRKRVTINTGGDMINLPAGATGAALWLHTIERSKIFVRDKFDDNPLLATDKINAWIEYGVFPPKIDHSDSIDRYSDLLRASHLIGTIADPNFKLKIIRIALEIKEANFPGTLGKRSVSELRTEYPGYFWQVLQPLIQSACNYLKFSSDGLEWLANMQSHLLQDEHQL